MSVLLTKIWAYITIAHADKATLGNQSITVKFNGRDTMRVISHQILLIILTILIVSHVPEI